MVTAIRKRQIFTFILSWIAYASLYLLRKPFGIIKTDLREELLFNQSQLGWLDTAFLFPYAAMQMLFAFAGDKFGTRNIFSASLVLSGCAVATFGFWNSIWIFAILLFLNGTAQASCWPNSVKAVGAWFPDKSCNSVLGIYGTCAFAGGIAGTGLAVYLQTSYSWRYVYLLPSIIVIIVGVIVFFTLRSPAEVGLNIPGKEITNAPLLNKVACGKWDWFHLWKIPIVPQIAIALFCLKIVRYSMYMWLPMFLLDFLQYTKLQAGMFSMMFEIGGVVGSALIGILIDRFFQRRSLFVTTIAAALSTVALAIFYFGSGWGIVTNSIFMLLAGAFNCGPDTILGGSVPMELGEADGRNSGAAVTGLVNGFGSVGTFLQGPIIGFLSEWYGWASVFFLMIGLSMFATASSFMASVIQDRQRQRVIRG